MQQLLHCCSQTSYSYLQKEEQQSLSKWFFVVMFAVVIFVFKTEQCKVDDGFAIVSNLGQCRSSIALVASQELFLEQLVLSLRVHDCFMTILAATLQRREQGCTREYRCTTRLACNALSTRSKKHCLPPKSFRLHQCTRCLQQCTMNMVAVSLLCYLPVAEMICCFCSTTTIISTCSLFGCCCSAHMKRQCLGARVIMSMKSLAYFCWSRFLHQGTLARLQPSA